MAITFLEERKIQRIYIIIFLIIILLTAWIIWRGFFVEKPVLVEEILTPPKKVEIDFKILEHPILQRLEPFEEIEPIEVEIEIGRENPFLPY